MRNILFRGKPLNCKVKGFAYGSLGVVRSDLVAIYQCKEFADDDMILVDVDTVGQYTGRNCYSDKGDKLHKIFDGDICDVTVFDCNGFEYHYTCKVEWCDGGFALVNDEKEFFKWLGEIEDTESDLTLIGNIYDNPELLKE